MSLFSDFAFAAACGLFPNLDTPRVEARWCALGEGLSARRLLAGSMAALMLVGTLPIHAQTTDIPAWDQRFAEFAKNDRMRTALVIKNSKDDTNWTSDWFRKAALAYKAYQQGAAMYRRLDNGYFDLSYILGMPSIDIATDLGTGQTENVVLRPILRPQDRLGKFIPPHFVLPDFKAWETALKNGNIQVDRFLARSANPDAGKSTDQLHREAVQDAYQQWGLVQQLSGIPAANQTIPNNQPYASIGPNIQKFYNDRQQRLQNMMQKTLTTYGQDSAQYAAALAAYQDWSQKIAEGQPQLDIQAAMTQLGQIDCDGAALVEEYATHALTMKLAVQRGDDKLKRTGEISSKYNSSPNDPISKLENWIGYTDLVQTLQAINSPSVGSKAPDAPNREMLGAALTQTIHQESMSEDQATAVKLANRKAMTEAIEKLRTLAQKKASALTDQQAIMDQAALSDAWASAQIDVAKALRIGNANALAIKLPPGTPLVLPTNIANAVPGATTPDNATTALQTAVAAAADTAGKTAEQGISDAFVGPPVSLGFLKAFGQALNAGISSVTGRPFDLTKIGGLNNA